MTEHHHDEDYESGVMVDVGAGAGALVIYTDDSLRGQEIEISPMGQDSHRTHTDVLRRRTPAGTMCAAVFGSLAAGDYHLWHASRTAPAVAHVEDGRVTELDWR